MIGFFTIIMNDITLCIAKLPQPCSWKRIKLSFEKLLGAGTVRRVNIIQKQTNLGVPYESVFIRFHRWPSHDIANTMRERLMAGKHVNVVYEKTSPWFWRCTLCRSTKM
jgi:hypothetical protein